LHKTGRSAVFSANAPFFRVPIFDNVRFQIVGEKMGIPNLMEIKLIHQ